MLIVNLHKNKNMKKNNLKITLFLFIAIASFSIVSCDAILQASKGQGNGNQGPKKPKPVTNQPNNTTINNNGSVLGKGGSVSFSGNIESLSPITEGLAGFNSAFSFTIGLDKNKETMDLSKELAPRILRFPGGTLANYFHPRGMGYGLKSEEMKTQGVIYDEQKKQQNLSTNALEDYIQYGKTIKHKCLYVANILNGTPEETIFAIGKIRDAGIEVVGVEFGNELYFKEYREKVPNVQNYIERAKAFVGPIRKAFPNIKLGVIAAKLANEAGGTVGTGEFADAWNSGLAKETFYDAFIVHTYTKDDDCAALMPNGINNAFNCEYDVLSPIANQASNSLFMPFKKYYGNKKMWYTEWNVKTPKTVGNTFIHAAFVTEFLMDMNDFNKKNNNVLEYSAYHNFISPFYGYGTIIPNTPNIPNLSGTKTAAPTSSFYAFKFLTELLSSGAQNINQTLSRNSGLDAKSFNGQLFYNPKTKKLFLWFVNKSGGTIKLENFGNINVSNGKVKYLKANYLYSNSGKTGFPLKDNYDIMKLEEKPLINNTLDGPLSIGIVEFDVL